MSDVIDNYIDEVSHFYWGILNSKINMQCFKCDFPLGVLKEIDNMSNICPHISFSKNKNKLEGYFYVHSTFSDHNHNCGNCHSDEKSLRVDKSFYINHKFFSNNYFLVDPNSHNKLKYDIFKKSIFYLIKNIIPNLKFNSFFGKFHFKDSKTLNEEKVFNLLIDIFKNYDNVKTISEICPVCHEETATHTHCNHPLCVRCFTKIKKHSYCNGEDCKCPLCREHF